MGAVPARLIILLEAASALSGEKHLMYVRIGSRVLLTRLDGKTNGGGGDLGRPLRDRDRNRTSISIMTQIPLNQTARADIPDPG